MLSAIGMKQLNVQNLTWLWISGFVILIDQITKTLAENSLQLYVMKPLLPYFNFTLAYNEGAAFSFLSDAGGWQRWFFVLMAFFMVMVLTIWLLRLREDEKLNALGLSLIIGGAIGNVWDRIAHGYVIDFIDFYVGTSHWPAFNLADTAICIGAFLLIFKSFGK